MSPIVSTSEVILQFSAEHCRYAFILDEVALQPVASVRTLSTRIFPQNRLSEVFCCLFPESGSVWGLGPRDVPMQGASVDDHSRPHRPCGRVGRRLALTTDMKKHPSHSDGDYIPGFPYFKGGDTTPTSEVMTAFPVVPTWRIGATDFWGWVMLWDGVVSFLRAMVVAIPPPTSAPTAKIAP